MSRCTTLYVYTTPKRIIRILPDLQTENTIINASNEDANFNIYLITLVFTSYLLTYLSACTQLMFYIIDQYQPLFYWSNIKCTVYTVINHGCSYMVKQVYIAVLWEK